MASLKLKKCKNCEARIGCKFTLCDSCITTSKEMVPVKEEKLDAEKLFKTQKDYIARTIKIMTKAEFREFLFESNFKNEDLFDGLEEELSSFDWIEGVNA